MTGARIERDSRQLRRELAAYRRRERRYEKRFLPATRTLWRLLPWLGRRRLEGRAELRRLRGLLGTRRASAQVLAPAAFQLLRLESRQRREGFLARVLRRALRPPARPVLRASRDRERLGALRALGAWAEGEGLAGRERSRALPRALREGLRAGRAWERLHRARRGEILGDPGRAGVVVRAWAREAARDRLGS